MIRFKTNNQQPKCQGRTRHNTSRFSWKDWYRTLVGSGTSQVLLGPSINTPHSIPVLTWCPSSGGHRREQNSVWQCARTKPLLKLLRMLHKFLPSANCIGLRWFAQILFNMPEVVSCPSLYFAPTTPISWGDVVLNKTSLTSSKSFSNTWTSVINYFYKCWIVPVSKHVVSYMYGFVLTNSNFPNHELVSWFTGLNNLSWETVHQYINKPWTQRSSTPTTVPSTPSQICSMFCSQIKVWSFLFDGFSTTCVCKLTYHAVFVFSASSTL